MLKFNFIYNNSYDICSARLSATSRASCEKRGGSEWYELTPAFEFEEMATLSSQSGDILLTSPKSFISPLFLSLNFSYDKLKKEWEQIVKNAPKTHKELPVIIGKFPSEEEIKELVVDYFKKEYTKLIEIIDNGYYVYNIRTPKSQNFPFEKPEGIDNFKEFEDFVKDFYKINGELILNPEALYELMEQGVKLIEVEGLYFLPEDEARRMEEEEKEEARRRIKDLLETAVEENSLFKVKKAGHIAQTYEIEEEEFKDEIKKTKEKIKKNLKKEIEANLYEIKEDLPSIYFFEDEFVEVESKAGNFIARKSDKVWNVKVPENKKGLFIGRKGANIKELAQKYNVKINLI